MANYLRDLTRVVLMSSDALQTDIQRIQLLQKVIKRDFSPRNSRVVGFLVRWRIKSVYGIGNTIGGK